MLPIIPFIQIPLPAPHAPASGGQPLAPVGGVALRGQGVAHTARAGEPSPVV